MSGCRSRWSTSGWPIPASPRRRSAAVGSSCTSCAFPPPGTRRWLPSGRARSGTADRPTGRREAARPRGHAPLGRRARLPGQGHHHARCPRRWPSRARPVRAPARRCRRQPGGRHVHGADERRRRRRPARPGVQPGLAIVSGRTAPMSTSTCAPTGRRTVVAADPARRSGRSTSSRSGSASTRTAGGDPVRCDPRGRRSTCWPG